MCSACFCLLSVLFVACLYLKKKGITSWTVKYFGICSNIRGSQYSSLCRHHFLVSLVHLLPLRWEVMGRPLGKPSRCFGNPQDKVIRGRRKLMVLVLFYYWRGDAKCESNQQRREQQPCFLALCKRTGGKCVGNRALYSDRHNNYHASWAYLTYIFLGWERWCPCYSMPHCCTEFCSEPKSSQM